MKLADVDLIVVHCSASRNSDDIGVPEIRKWHTDPPPAGNGWADIGYHYVIRRDGVVELGRPLEQMGAHVKGHNSNSIGICLVGGFGGAADQLPEDNFTDAQLTTLVWVIAQLLPRCHPKIRIAGHNEFANKACPCFNVPAWWSNVPRSQKEPVPDTEKLRTTLLLERIAQLEEDIRKIRLSLRK